MSAQHRILPPSAARAGIDERQHVAELALGREWCAQGKHYVKSALMTGHATAACTDCARLLRRARRLRKAGKAGKAERKSA